MCEIGQKIGCKNVVVVPLVSEKIYKQANQGEFCKSIK